MPLEIVKDPTGSRHVRNATSLSCVHHPRRAKSAGVKTVPIAHRVCRPLHLTIVAIAMFFTGLMPGCMCEARSNDGCDGGSSGTGDAGCGTGYDDGDTRGDTWRSIPPTTDHPGRDTGIRDTAPWSCVEPLPSDFTCKAPDAVKGETVCTDAMIEALIAACFRGGASCTKTKAAYPACSKCMLSEPGWIFTGYLNQGACIRAVDATSSCGTSARCAAECAAYMCEACDYVSGTGRDGVGSEYSDCHHDVLAGPVLGDAGDGGEADVADATFDDISDVTTDADASFAESGGGSSSAPGACWTLAAKDLPACEADPRLRPCFVETWDDLPIFYRGACRDGANWEKAHLGDGTGDAGPSDGGTDADAAETDGTSED